MISLITDIIGRFWKNQFLRFLFIGGVNTIFGYSVFAILVFCRLHYSLALIVSTVLGVIFNFKTLGIIVFKDGKNSKIFRFVTVYIILYFLNLAIISGLKYTGMNTYSAGAAAILPVAFTGYFLNKRFVFGYLKQRKSFDSV